MVEQISLPVIIPEKLLISPGVWNDNTYTALELGDAFARTDWQNKEKISLWLNHDDSNTSAFVGYVKNPKLASQGRVFGDLEIWDEKTAVLLTQAMAKFGISAKIMGEENKSGKMQNFTFENFSIVTVPACSDAYINLSKKEDGKNSKYLINKELAELARGEGKGQGNEPQGDGGTGYCYCSKCGYKMKHEKNMPCNEMKCPKCGTVMTGVAPKEMAVKSDESKSPLDKIERRLENMERLQEEKKEEKVEEKVEEKKEEEVTKEPEEKELSGKIDVLSEKFDKLISLLSKKFEEKELEEEPKEEKKEETPEEEKTIDPEGEVLLPKEEEATEAVEKEVENKELTAVKKELSEIKKKLSAPKSKTVRNLSSNNVGNGEEYDANVFCDFLHKVESPVRIL